MLVGGSEHIIKMSLALLHEVHVRAMETLFDEQNQPMF